MDIDTQTAIRIGIAVIRLFNKKPMANGRYRTSFGDKTVEGVGNCVHRILEESRIADKKATPTQVKAMAFNSKFFTNLSGDILRIVFCSENSMHVINDTDKVTAYIDYDAVDTTKEKFHHLVETPKYG